MIQQSKLLLLIISILFIWSCKESVPEIEHEINPADYLIHESSDFSDAKALFSVKTGVSHYQGQAHSYWMNNDLYKLTNDNKIGKVICNPVPENYSYEFLPKQVLPFKDTHFLLSYVDLEESYIIHKETGAATKICFINAMGGHFWEWDEQSIRVVDSTLYYINRDRKLYFLSNFFDLNCQEEIISETERLASFFEINNNGTIAIKYQEYLDGYCNLILKNGSNLPLNASEFKKEDDGCLYYVSDRNIKRFCDHEAEVLYQAPNYGDVDYFFGSGRESFTIEKNSGRIILIAGGFVNTITGEYISYSDIIGEYPRVGSQHLISNNKVYDIFHPNPEPEDYRKDYWKNNKMEKSKLVIFDLSDFSSKVYEFETNLFVSRIFYADEDVLLVNTSTLSPVSSGSFTEDTALFDLKETELINNNIMVSKYLID